MKANLMTRLLPRTFKCAFLALGAVLISAGSAGAGSGASPDDVARFMAGLPPKAESPLVPLTQTPAWQHHARVFSSAWARLDQRQLARVRAWSGENLKESQANMFYMFSGPDFLYADAFFPKASTYVLSGLEPVSQVPDPTMLARRSLASALGELRSSLNSVLSYSFFQTKHMRRDLNSGQMTGTLPILYVFLARSGKTIHEVSFVSLDKDGTVLPSQGSANAADQGVKIVFSKGEGPRQTLYYFRTDVSNGGVANSGFLRFCEHLGTGDSFVKSASYLMHSDGFSKVRDFLLTRSVTLVQDDSGVPVRFFEANGWMLRPHGRYRGPIRLFGSRYQAQLKELFRKGPSSPLAFGIGYRWRANDSNLMVGVRKIATSAQPSVPAEASR
ncbi:MAG TPA: hypothetical protein VFX94_03165, partial [Burkholderiales bacterium]|nr:hypothetical protein [Burkholderiales bacterium]